ncbi:MAG: crossover junction endodeoxyribonuclease RuvC [Anaerolineaceae bacterium]|jgi:crossover junction endodeoxyribonuclease RuvC
MLVLGIDPGTATTGFGLVEETADKELRVVDYGVILTKPSTPPEKRLQQIHESIQQLILLHQPDCGAVEKLYFQKNVTNALAVGQARGVVLLAMAEAGIPISEYSPQEVKQSVTGYGAAQKRQIQQMVQTLLNLPDLPKPDDAADALAIAVCHLHSTGYQALLAGK